MENVKQRSIEEQPVVVIVFDRIKGTYCVDSGPWLEHGYIDPDKRAPKSVTTQSASTPPPEDVLRCMKSLVAGHTNHCHWYAWNGSTWVDTMKENCNSSCPNP